MFHFASKKPGTIHSDYKALLYNCLCTSSSPPQRLPGRRSSVSRGLFRRGTARLPPPGAAAFLRFVEQRAELKIPPKKPEVEHKPHEFFPQI